MFIPFIGVVPSVSVLGLCLPARLVEAPGKVHGRKNCPEILCFWKKNVSFTFRLEDLTGVEFEVGNDFSSVLKAWLYCVSV